MPRRLRHSSVAQFDAEFSRAPDAGDLLPTFVTPGDAQKYIDQVDTDYKRLNLTITQSSVSAEFKVQWATQMAGWLAFSVPARASVGFLDTKSTMEQTDRWAAQLGDFASAFQKAGGTMVGPAPQSPGQGTGAPATLGDVTKLIVAVGAVAAIVVLGPKLLK